MLNVVCGAMFSGKSEELIRRIHRAKYAGQKVSAFNHALDTRQNKNIVSHNGLEVETHSINEPERIMDVVEREDPDVVAVDECQFFNINIAYILNDLAISEDVMAAGLNTDYRGRPFGPMPMLMALADHVTTLTAVCTECGREATRTQRLFQSEEQVVVGGKETHGARCRKCHDPYLATVEV